MKIKNVKPGRILKLQRGQIEKDFYFDSKWKVDKVYENHVLAHSVKVPAIRRSFSYGDLVVLGFELSGSEAFDDMEV